MRPMTGKTSRLDEKIIQYGIIVVFICTSLAYALMTPAYEGFDETAHYSYISYLAETGRIPDFRSTKIDANVENDQKLIPKPYNSFPPYQNNGGITYYRFFNEMGDTDRSAAYQKLWINGTAETHYQEGTTLNWQGQHPPLYYITMLLPYNLSKDWPTGYKLIFLRVCSLALVWLGMYIWILALRRFTLQETRMFFLSGAAVILFIPSFYFDLARLGNDSLTALLSSLCFYFIVRVYMGNKTDYKYIIYLSITIGLGLLTKMLFVPIMGGCAAFVMITGFRRWVGIRTLLINLSILILVPLTISGWWYNLFHARYGMYLGSAEFYTFGTIGKASVNLSLVEYLIEVGRSTTSFIKTFLWCGTWSWLKLPYWYYVVFIPIPFIVLNNVRCVWKKSGEDVRQITIAASLVILALLAGFAHHAATRIAYTGRGSGTGGYYLFAAWPFLAIIFSYVMSAKNRVLLILTSFIFVILIIFEMEGFWREVLAYSGIWYKTSTNAFGVGYVVPTLTNIQLALARHEQLAISLPAMILFLASVPLKLGIIIYVNLMFGKALLSRNENI